MLLSSVEHGGWIAVDATEGSTGRLVYDMNPYYDKARHRIHNWECRANVRTEFRHQREARDKDIPLRILLQEAKRKGSGEKPEPTEE